MQTFMATRPAEGDHAPYFGKYIELVEGTDLLGALREQIGATLATLRGVSEQDSLRRYAEGKWSLREVVGHITDTERIMAYRALRIGRGDSTPLPGFEQDGYIAAAGFDRVAWTRLLEEFEQVRRNTVMLFEDFDADAWERRGTASGNPITTRALGFIIAGHELHHMKIVRERYLSSR